MSSRLGNVVVVGIQAGDEGKGKVVDLLCGPFDWVVRYQGGHNAGHTVQIGDKKTALHLLPSGILHPGKKCVLGNGMVIDPHALAIEIAQFDCHGRLFISDRAHLIMPWHSEIERANSGHYGPNRIGTTGRGIGPAYEDKAGRRGFRIGNVLNGKNFEDQAWRIWSFWALAREGSSGKETDVEEFRNFVLSAQLLTPFVYDTRSLLNQAMTKGESILFEGAQGYLLDVDHGSYPFVTSSNPTFGGACTGTGVALKNASVLGIAKAYMTRVGGGPFPTKDVGFVGRHMQRVGVEKGTSTGRDRDCGWFDAVAAREAVMVNGVDALAITKLDVLTDLPGEELKICTHYKLDGEKIDYIPADPEDFARCEPQYDVRMPGWTEDIRNVRHFGDLPCSARQYLMAIQSLVGARIKILSVGPERSETMIFETAPVMPWMDDVLKRPVAV